MTIDEPFLTNEIRALEQELERARMTAIRSEALIAAYKILIDLITKESVDETPDS